MSTGGFDTSRPPLLRRRSADVPALPRLLVLAIVASVSVGCSSQKVSVEVGAPAPDISLVGANRERVLPQPLRLQDFREQTVVLAFFYKARTPG